MAVEKGIIVKKGAWYAYGKDNIGQGKEETRRFIKENGDIAKKIEESLLASLQEQAQPKAVSRLRPSADRTSAPGGKENLFAPNRAGPGPRLLPLGSA